MFFLILEKVNIDSATTNFEIVLKTVNKKPKSRNRKALHKYTFFPGFEKYLSFQARFILIKEFKELQRSAIFEYKWLWKYICHLQYCKNDLLKFIDVAVHIQNTFSEWRWIQWKFYVTYLQITETE